MSMYERFFNLPKTKKEVNIFLINTLETVAELNINVNNEYNILSKVIL